MRGIRILIAWCFAATALLAFWDVVRFTPTKVYTDGSGPDPSFIAKAVLILIFLAVGSLFATASWTVLTKRESARKWAVLSSYVLTLIGLLLLYAHPFSLIEKGWIPLLVGVTGLAVFYPLGITNPQTQAPSAPIPSDGTNAIIDKLVVVLAVLAVWSGGSLWSRWAQTHALSENLPPYFYVRFIVAVLLVVTLHEGGHLLAALSLRMKVIHFAIGPLEWSNSSGKKRMRVQPGWRSWLRGQTLVAPEDLRGFRERKILQVAAGPFVSIAAGMTALALVLTCVGSPWQDSWLILSRFATISLALGIFNLVPFRIGPGYSDGAKLYQLLSSGLWCRYQLLLGMIYATTITPIRARDLDIDTIQESAGGIATGQDEAYMHLCAYSCFLDRGEPSNAAIELTKAVNVCQQSSVDVPGEWITIFVFGSALLLRDPAAARKWWNEFESKKTDKLMAESWTSFSALLWAEGRRDEAEEAWRKADTWARELTNSGFAEAERNAVLLLRRAMDESPIASPPEP